MENGRETKPDRSYLLKEYEECFEQLRFYDTRQTDFVKYYYALASAVIAAQFALLKFLTSTTNSFFDSLIALSFVCFIAGVLFYVAMLRNRVYFVFVARQINALRGYLLKADPGFNLNQMYTTTELPTYRAGSLQTVEIFGVTLTSSLFGAALVYGISSKFAFPLPLAFSASFLILIAIIQIVLGIRYLRSENRKSANDVIKDQG